MNEAKFKRIQLSKNESVLNYEGTVEADKKPDGKYYNYRPDTDPVEAVIALSIGQSVTPRGSVEVKHFKERKYGEVDTIHVSAKNPHELKEKLYAMVDAYIGYYYDFTNGV